MEHIYFIYDGSLNVETQTMEIVTLDSGHFVGERSFHTHEVANATVIAEQDTRVVEWRQDELRKLLKRNPSMLKDFNSALHHDLVKKLYR
mgnify:CR=1 FL=1